MKTTRLKHSAITAFAALALASLASINNARADFPLATFDTDISANDGIGSNPAGGPTVVVWDGAQNGPNGPAGGSEHVTVLFTNAGTSWQQCQLNFTRPEWPGVDVPSYVNVEWDIKVDVANSFLGPNGNYGEVHPIIQSWSDGSPGWADLGGIQITNTSGWQHMKMSVAAFSGHMTRFVFAFISNGGNNVTNTCSYWIDNIVLTSPPLPPPTLASPVPAPKESGLTLLPTTGLYQRVMVYPGPLGNGFGWYGAGQPVSYSFTITNFPTVGNYSAQMFLIPTNAMQYGAGDTSVDWNCTNDLVFSIASNGNNPATAWGVTLAAKTNSPGALGQGNPNVTLTNFAYNTLPLGTWTVTFNNNTDYTITAPNNTVVSGSIPADVANIISGNAGGNLGLVPYFGIQPNNAVGFGKPSVFSKIKITQGASVLVEDNFNLGYLETTNTWSILSDYQKGVTVGTGDLAYYVPWNTPNDQGYSTMLAAASPAGPWVDFAPSSSWLLVSGKRTALVGKAQLQSTLGGTDAAYFRLVKRVFTKLQVLLPGETNAPNTLTGKVGTPDPVTLGNFTTVTINAVDDAWNVVNSGATINLTSTDSGAILPLDAALVNGTLQQTILFGTAGSWTVTATNTSAVMPAVTSSTVTVTP